MSLEQKIEGVKKWFSQWSNHEGFVDKFFWKLTREGVSKTNQHVFTNSNIGEYQLSLDALVDNIINEYESGTHKLLIRLSFSKTYKDTTLPSFMVVFNENAKTTRSSTSMNNLGFMKVFTEMNQQMMMQQQQAHKMELDHQRELAKMKAQDLNDRIAGLENNQQSESQFWGFVEKLIDNSDRLTDMWKKIKETNKEANVPKLATTAPDRITTTPQQKITVNQPINEPMNNDTQEPLNLNQAIPLLNAFHQRYPRVLEVIEALFLSYQEEPQVMENQFENLLNGNNE